MKFQTSIVLVFGLVATASAQGGFFRDMFGGSGAGQQGGHAGGIGSLMGGSNPMNGLGNVMGGMGGVSNALGQLGSLNDLRNGFMQNTMEALRSIPRSIASDLETMPQRLGQQKDTFDQNSQRLLHHFVNEMSQVQQIMSNAFNNGASSTLANLFTNMMGVLPRLAGTVAQMAQARMGLGHLMPSLWNSLMSVGSGMMTDMSSSFGSVGSNLGSMPFSAIRMMMSPLTSLSNLMGGSMSGGSGSGMAGGMSGGMGGSQGGLGSFFGNANRGVQGYGLVSTLTGGTSGILDSTGDAVDGVLESSPKNNEEGKRLRRLRA